MQCQNRAILPVNYRMQQAAYRFITTVCYVTGRMPCLFWLRWRYFCIIDFQNMSTAGKLTKNFGALSVIQVANFLIPFLVLPVIVRIIGPAHFGLLNFLTAIVTYFVLLINYGFDYTATRTVARNKDNQQVVNDIFSSVFFARLWLFAVSLLLFTMLLFAMDKMYQAPLVSILSFASCLANVFMPNWLFQGMEQLQKAAIWNVVIKLVFSVTMILLIHLPEDYWIYALLTSISQILAGIWLFIYACRRFHIKLTFVPLKRVWQLLYEDRAVFISTLMINLYTTSNIVLLGLLKPENEVGIFTAASRIVGVVQTVMLLPLSQTLFPHVGKSFSLNREEGLTEVKKLFPLVAVLAFCVTVGLFITAPLAIHILFGAEFSASANVLRIMSLTPFIVTISNLLGTQVLLNLKKDKAFLRMTIVGSVICIGLNLLLTPALSYYGTALAWVLTESIITIGMALIIYRQGIRLFDSRYWRLSWLMEAAGKLKKR